MESRVGLWIDHRRATVVAIENGEVTVKVIESNVGPRTRLSGGARSATSYGPQDVASEGQRDRRYKHLLDMYYQDVIRTIKDAEAILILGPGEAKEELKKRVERSKALKGRLIGVETADKMTKRQLVGAVRRRFGE